MKKAFLALAWISLLNQPLWGAWGTPSILQGKDEGDSYYDFDPNAGYDYVPRYDRGYRGDDYSGRENFLIGSKYQTQKPLNKI